MATISLYADKVNQMTQLLRFTRASADSFNGDLKNMHEKMLSVDINKCDLDDEISMVQSIIDEEDDTITSLATFENELDEFVSDVVIVDNKSGECINKSKEKFYDKYYYLKPECEKNGWDKIGESINKGLDRIKTGWNKAKEVLKCAIDWVCDNWKEILTVVAIVALTVFAVVGAIATFGAGTVALVALVGGVIGVGGQFICDVVESILDKKWSFSSFEDYCYAFLGGAIGGILMLNPAGRVCNITASNCVETMFAKVCPVIVKNLFGKVAIAAMFEEFISSTVPACISNMTGGEYTAYSEIICDVGVSLVSGLIIGAACGWVSGLITESIAKGNPHKQVLRRLAGHDGYSNAYERTISTAASRHLDFKFNIFKRYKKTIRNGVLGGLVDSFMENVGNGAFEFKYEKAKENTEES